jgi:hypothetical protein
MRISCVFLAGLLCPLVLLGQNQVGVEEFRASVVKITSKAPEGQARTDIRIDGRIEEGNSGGAIIMNGSVAGMSQDGWDGCQVKIGPDRSRLQRSASH